MSHGDRVTRLPEGFTVKATSENAPFAVASDEGRRIYTTMFHPEVVHTPRRGEAARQLRAQDRRAAGRLDDGALPRERGRAASRSRSAAARVICGLSGGVDSAVAAVLIHEAIGDQLTCIFVDHGLLRAERGRRGRRACSAGTTTSRSCTSMRAKLFLDALAGVADPEQKRKTIGSLFIDVFDEEARSSAGAASSSRRARSIPT